MKPNFMGAREESWVISSTINANDTALPRSELIVDTLASGFGLDVDDPVIWPAEEADGLRCVRQPTSKLPILAQHFEIL